MTTEALRVIDNLYKKHGDKAYIGEAISQREHVIQAALLAENFFVNNATDDTYKNEIVLGALLHDIGNMLQYEHPGEYELTGEYGIMHHEIYGANYLKELGFSDLVCEIVGTHVLTKRYLITKNAEYYHKLSDASKETYMYQGGELNEREIARYEENPFKNIHLKMREWDDAAKSTDPELLEKIKNIDIVEYYSKFL